jgi:hypothetical protein
MIPINPYKKIVYEQQLLHKQRDIILMTSENTPGPVEIPGFGC